MCKDGKINDDGSDLLGRMIYNCWFFTQKIHFSDIRFNEESPCVDYFEQCCETGEILTHPPTTPHSVETIKRPQTCGFRNVEGVGFRITGNNDNEAEYGVRDLKIH